MENHPECTPKRKDVPIEAAITSYPNPIKKDAFSKPDSLKIHLIEEKMREIMDILDLDLSDESLASTPCRIARMYVKEIFSGLNPSAFPPITLHPHKIHEDEMILVKDISLISFCEHHFVPFEGKAHIAYIPNQSIIGLSKINRIVQYFSKRPQLQERLTIQIADSLSSILQTSHIAVHITAKHFCVAARGIKDTASQTTTQVFRGKFLEDSQKRSEFFNAIHPNVTQA